MSNGKLEAAFTPTHRRIMAILEDGAMHHRDEIFKCLWDEQSKPETVWQHMATLRKLLRLGDRDVASIKVAANIYYQLVEVPSQAPTV